MHTRISIIHVNLYLNVCFSVIPKIKMDCCDLHRAAAERRIGSRRPRAWCHWTVSRPSVPGCFVTYISENVVCLITMPTCNLLPTRSRAELSFVSSSRRRPRFLAWPVRGAPGVPCQPVTPSTRDPATGGGVGGASSLQEQSLGRGSGRTPCDFQGCVRLRSFVPIRL